MNARHQFTEQADVQAAIAILQTSAREQRMLTMDARAARKAEQMRQAFVHIRGCHERALFYHARLLAAEIEADFHYYRDRYDEQCAKASDAIRRAKIERDCR